LKKSERIVGGAGSNLEETLVILHIFPQILRKDKQVFIF